MLTNKPKPVTLGVAHSVPMQESDRLRAAYVYWRQQGYRACFALESARINVAKGKTRYPSFHFDTNPTDSDGGRYIENPEAMGMRLESWADAISDAVDHSGWWLDPDGFGENVRGVVYRLPARNGRAVFLAGYADPYNADAQTGEGPAYLSMTPIIADEPVFPYHRQRAVSAWGYSRSVAATLTRRDILETLNDNAKRDAAQMADGIAESMAENERAYHEAWQAGNNARAVKREALEAAQTWKEDARAVCEFFAMRHESPGPDARRNVMRILIRAARKSKKAFSAARIRAHALELPARSSTVGKPGSSTYNAMGFWDAYDNA